MLKIQKASAGSGKTYALARDYILNLISYKTDKGEWSIRNERQIEDALRHILAITFTNKATNEMKVRIIKNLSLLSKAAKAPYSKELADKVPYLAEFMLLLGVDHKAIGENAEAALRVILNNYSYFNISTIDSFFQEILRTFAYEANLNDSYQLEIDNTFVNDAALESAINELDTHPSEMGNASFWLKTIMNDEAKRSQKWNPFNKKASNGSIYSKIRDALAQIEKEDYKDIKEKIDVYYNNKKHLEELPQIYISLRKKAHREREKHLKVIKAALAHVENLIAKYNYPESQLSKTFTRQLNKIRDLQINDTADFSFSKILADKTVFLSKFREKRNPLDIAAVRLYKLLNAWNTPHRDFYFKNWTVFGPLFPYFGLMLEVRTFLTKVLATNNLIKLSDTNYILKKIIGEEDAPFVYERLGNRIDNYLIDEFQDTSRMQWDIIKPLIDEGMAKMCDSLIIGDPKQSIYRFRNADHRLITTTVPALFVDHISAGHSKEDNTNWRSHTNIVKFNNYFFKQLAASVNQKSMATGKGSDFIGLYSNVVQYPHNLEGLGYVEIRRFENNKGSDFDSEDFDDESGAEDRFGKNWFEARVLSNLPLIITSLIKRGYRSKDIGILVNTNDQGKDVVKTLIAYNDTQSNENKIDFLSEESLLISSSAAVDMIIQVLEKLAHPAKIIKSGNPGTVNSDDADDKETPKSDDTISTSTEAAESQSPRYLKWKDLKFNFSVFSHNHPELSQAQKIMSFLNGPDEDNLIVSLVESLPVPSITAITEAAIKLFLDESQRRQDAIYLASFQDIVNEYSANHSSDPASFLEWWHSRGKRLSVASPEGTDAVQIMTIHKSKGLEFKCVIVPFAQDSFYPSSKKAEWRWVKTKPVKDICLPPVLPVKTSKEIKDSDFSVLYREYIDQVLTDRINMYYVAFTRAKNELYIFTKNPSKGLTSISDHLSAIPSGEFKDAEFSAEEKANVLDLKDFVFSEDGEIISYGSPLTEEQIAAENMKEDSRPSIPSYYFSDYYVNKRQPRLRSVATTVSPSGEFTNP